MMSCEEVRRRLPVVADGDLAPEEAAWFEEHLSACTECSREAAGLLAAVAELRRAPVPAVELPCGSAVAAWVLQQEATGKARRRSWTLLAPAAAVAVCTAAALTIARPQAPSAAGVTPPVRVQDAAPQLWVSDDESTGRHVLLAPGPAPSTGQPL